jgi:ribosomal protein L23
MFGVNMAKTKKAVKKAVKKVFGEVKKPVEKKSTSSSARKHIESLSTQRRDAAVVWGMIKDGNHSTDEIKAICKDKGFDTLLGEL